MAKEKKPSIYADRGTIGSSDELDEYGVWVKSEPQDLSSVGIETGELPGNDFMDFEIPDMDDDLSGMSAPLPETGTNAVLDDDFDLPDMDSGSGEDNNGDVFNFGDLTEQIDTDETSAETESDPFADYPENTDTVIPDFDEDALVSFSDDEPEIIPEDFSLEEVSEEAPLEDFTAENSSPEELPELDDFSDISIEDDFPPEDFSAENLSETPDEDFSEPEGVEADSSGGPDIEPGGETEDGEPDALPDTEDDPSFAELPPPPHEQNAGQKDQSPDLSTQLLMKIAEELSSIRNELTTLKKEFSGIKATTAVTEGPAEKDYFGEEDDGKISLTGDELNNILNTADFTEEAGADAAVSDVVELADDLTVPEEDTPLDFAPLEDVPLEEAPLEELSLADDSFQADSLEELPELTSGDLDITAEDPSIEFGPEDSEPDETPAESDSDLETLADLNMEIDLGEPDLGILADETGLDNLFDTGEDIQEQVEIDEVDLDKIEDFEIAEDFIPELTAGETEELSEIRENGVEPMTAAPDPEDADYLVQDPLAGDSREIDFDIEEIPIDLSLDDISEDSLSEDADDAIDLSEAVIDEPDLSSELQDIPVEEPSLDDISEDSLSEDADDAIDLSEAVIDEPDLSSELQDIPVEEPSLDDISINLDLSELDSAETDFGELDSIDMSSEELDSESGGMEMDFAEPVSEEALEIIDIVPDEIPPAEEPEPAEFDAEELSLDLELPSNDELSLLSEDFVEEDELLPAEDFSAETFPEAEFSAEEIAEEEIPTEESPLEESFEELALEELPLEELTSEELSDDSRPLFEETGEDLETLEALDFEESPQDELAEIAEPLPAGKKQPAAAQNDGNNDDLKLPGHLKQELKTVLSYMDQLLEALPDEKIEEFARSEYYDTYKKLFKDLGLA